MERTVVQTEPYCVGLNLASAPRREVLGWVIGAVGAIALTGLLPIVMSPVQVSCSLSKAKRGGYQCHCNSFP